jgi:exo-beta-1,3-glucanase (GH17 family)
VALEMGGDVVVVEQGVVYVEEEDDVIGHEDTVYVIPFAYGEELPSVNVTYFYGESAKCHGFSA